MDLFPRAQLFSSSWLPSFQLIAPPYTQSSLGTLSFPLPLSSVCHDVLWLPIPIHTQYLIICIVLLSLTTLCCSYIDFDLISCSEGHVFLSLMRLGQTSDPVGIPAEKPQ